MEHFSKKCFGIYYGLAQFSSTDMDQSVMEVVASIGLNPFYKNHHITMEVHILKEFCKPFYGKTLKVLLTGFLRDERDFSSKELLVDAIKRDIDEARRLLREDDEQIRLREHYTSIVYRS